jgi:hypothetical protein
VASVYLRSRTINAADAFDVCRHLSAAKEWATLATVYSHLLLSIQTRDQARYLDWTRYFFALEAPWPDPILLPLRVTLRALQARQLLLAGEPIDRHEEDLERLIADIGDDPAGQLAIAFAYLQTGIMREDLPADVVAVRTIRSTRAARRAAAFAISSNEPPEALFWGVIRHIKDVHDIRRLMGVLREFTPEERRLILSQPPSHDMLVFLADGCYSHEVDKPAAERDWDAVFAALDELAALGREAGVVTAIVAAVRARALVMADYFDQVDDALDMLKSTSDGGDDYARFVLNWSQGRIALAHGRPGEAFHHFGDALVIAPDEDYSPFRFDALVHGLQAAGRTEHWIEAQHWCIEAIRMSRRRPGGDIYEVAELLGELGWLYWRTGALTKACGAMFGAVAQLLSPVAPGDSRFNEVVWKTGHVLGWLMQVASLGRSPDSAVDGGTYVEPFVGFLCRPNPAIGALPRGHGLEVLLAQLGGFVAAVGCLRLARQAFIRAADRAAQEGLWLYASTTDGARGSVEAYLGDFEAAVAATASGMRASAVLHAAQMANATTVTLMWRGNLESAWRTLPDDERERAERIEVFRGVIWPAFVRLLADADDDAEALRSVKRLGASLEAAGESLAAGPQWQAIVNCMTLAFTGARLSDIKRLIAGLSTGDTFQRAVLYAALARAAAAPPSDAAKAQGVLLLFTEDLNRSDRFVREGLARWVTRHWRDEAASRGFRLARPAVLRDTLTATTDAPSAVASAAHVLLAAEVATATQYEASMRDRLRNLATANVAGASV